MTDQSWAKGHIQSEEPWTLSKACGRKKMGFNGKQWRRRVMERKVWCHQLAFGVTSSQNVPPKIKGMSKHDDMSSFWWKKEAECRFGNADWHRAAQVCNMIYLHHHLLPSQRLAVRCVGRHVGPLQLQCDIATLLLEGSGQLLEARLLFFHRGQDAGGRANVIVLHVRGRWQRYGSSNMGSEGGEKGGGGGGIGSLETPWPSRMGINRLTHASSSTRFGFVEMEGDFSSSTGWDCHHHDCRDAKQVEYTGWAWS